MFDSLYFQCPMCGKEVEEQTKSGPCALQNFKLDEDLPVWIMEDFAGTETTCYNCGKRLKIIIDFDVKINVKRKTVEPIDNLDYVELEYRKKLAKQKKEQTKKNLNKGL